MGHIKSQAIVDLGLHLSSIGIRDADTAAICDVKIETVRRWRRLYQRRGVRRFGEHGAIGSPCPRCDGAELDSAAYALLLGWYLGDGHISRTRRAFRLLIVSDNRYPGLLDEIAAALAAVRPGTVAMRQPRPGCTAVSTTWKHWPCLFPQHGLGRKHERRIALTPWQSDIVGQHPGRFVRGLFHSDGCRITNWTVRTVAGQPKRYEYPRYFFTDASEDILAICGQALSSLGISYRRPTPRNISVAQSASVAILDQHVGPKY